MLPIVMAYRPGPAHPHYNIDKSWRSMVVSEENSEVTNGVYDLVLTYAGEGTIFKRNMWQIEIFYLPA